MTTTRQGSGNNVRKDFKELRVKEANDRLAVWTALGTAKQLEVLNDRPGKSLKQRARLEALLSKGKRAAQKPVTPVAVAPIVEAPVEPARPKAKERRAADKARTAASK